MTDLAIDRRTDLGWSAIDDRTVATVRGLVADIVESVGGHPGTAISLAPVAFTLFNRIIRHDPSDPHWLGRDRFILSAGHSALTLYLQLFLAGYPIEMEDLRTMRTLGSRVHGHPEYEVDHGVEMTTGPLGEGFATAVGFAMAARRERGLFDPETADGQSVFDHTIWVIASDGDIHEGVVAEASSLAGHQRLGNLVVIWDDNRISAEDDTSVSMSEDTLAKYAAMGWHVRSVDWTSGGEYREDVDALAEALDDARAETGRPSIIGLRTIMGWPTPTKQATGDIHGSPLGTDEVRGLKVAMGLDPDVDFLLEDEVVEHGRRAVDRGRALREEWDERFAAWAAAQPARKALLDRLIAGELPSGWQDALPVFDSGSEVATRVASGAVLNSLKDVLPELWGGSADMNESTSANMIGEPSFVPTELTTRLFGDGHRYGRTLHFGVREHAMGAALNGIALHGPTRGYGATFLQFSFHMLPSVRLGSLMGLRTIFIWTHDSIGLGPDGPTHQPVEHLAALRAMPGIDVIRPGDANEVVETWKRVLAKRNGPSGFVFSRQKLPVLARSEVGDGGAFAPAAGAQRGAYVLADPAEGLDLDVILIATGSELALAVASRETLAAEGIGARVVSMPCREWFVAEPLDYRDAVLPPHVRARVSIEAASVLGWRDFVGDAGRTVGLDHFGASAPADVLFEEYGFTVENVTAEARASVAAAKLPASVSAAQR